MSSNNEPQTAEVRLRESFQRLKENKPMRVAPGTSVNKSNVAKEAGYKDPTSFRAERFPTLVWEIKAYQEIIANAQPSAYQKKKRQKIEKASADYRLEEVKVQRDIAQSQVSSLKRAYIELLKENKSLLARGDNIIPLLRLP